MKIRSNSMMRRVSTFTVKYRLRVVLTLFTCIAFVMLVRLGYVQFVLGEEITEKAVETWLRDISFQPDRGLILDSKGRQLTTSVSAASVIVVPQQIKDKEKVGNHLADIMQITLEDAIDYVSKRVSSVRIHPAGRKISPEQEMAIRLLKLEGVYLAKDSKRHYPHGNYLSHVLGFTGIDNQGLTGLELMYDEKLKGKSGSFSYFSDAKGGKIPNLDNVYKPPKDGWHLKTTIDLDIQTIVERELDYAQLKYNPDGAIAIVVDPNNGEVLAMSSRPNFNPKNYKQVPQEVFNRNLPIWSTFEPGSTFKIITLAAALEEDLIDLNKDRYFDKGFTTVGNARLRCWKKGGHGSQTLLEVVQNSCNPGFVHLGNLLGDKELFSYIREVGLGEKTGIDLQGEGTGILFKPEQVGPVELATTSFGQGVSVTPIQQVMAVAAAVNGGYLYEPYIADEWINPVTEKVTEKHEPKIKERVISEETSKEVRSTLESVVATGTGRPAYVDGYRVGGKTGTAQKVGPGGTYLQNNYIVSFIGFAPANDPEIVVYIAIDNPKETVQFGGVVAAPIVGTVIEDSLMALGIEPSTEGLEKDYLWPEQPKVEVPNLIGLDKEELTEYMTNLSIEVDGKGDYIMDQEPKPGTKIEEGSKVRIYLTNKNGRD